MKPLAMPGYQDLRKLRHNTPALTLGLVVFMIAVATVFVPSPAALAATNNILNPSFETAGANSADAANWTEGTNHARSSDQVHSGGWALKSTYTGTGTSTRTAAIAVTPNTTSLLVY